MGGQPPPDCPGHRDQLHPTQRDTEKCEAGSDPFQRKRQQAQCDRCGEQKQQKGGAGNPDDRERRNQARTFEVSPNFAGIIPAAIRIALRACRLDRQCLLVSRATPVAAVLQVTADSC